MTRAIQLESIAQSLLEQYSHHQHQSHQSTGLDLTQDVSQIKWLLPKFAQLVEQHADQPIDTLRPEFRNIILEHFFVDEPGDHCMDRSETAHVNQIINFTTRLLREAKRTVREKSGWRTSAPIPMFG